MKESGHIRDDQYKEIFLDVGELCIAEEPTLIKTILGSCISLTLFSPKHHVGAMCHAMLPRKTNSLKPPQFDQRFKYVDTAIQHMLDSFRRMNIPLDELEANLFGGADMNVDKKTPDSRKVGKRNIREAMKLLKRNGLQLAGRDTSGKAGRKVFFNSFTGEIVHRKLKKKADLHPAAAG